MSGQEHLCCGFLLKVKWMFGSCSVTILTWVLSLIDNDLLVADPVDPQNQQDWELLTTSIAGLLVRAEENPKIVVMYRTVTNKNPMQKEIMWQQYCLCLAVPEYQNFGGKHFLILGPESGRVWWLKNVQYLQKKIPLPMVFSAWKETQVDSS